MDADLMLVVGVVLLMLALPPLLSAFSEGRPPRAAAILVMIGGTLLVLALTDRPGGYQIAEIPKVFLTVIGRYLN